MKDRFVGLHAVINKHSLSILKANMTRVQEPASNIATV